MIRKSIMTIIAVVSAMSLSVALVGCGSADTSKMVGTWELSGTNMGGVAVDEETLEFIGELGALPTLELNEDGTFTLNYFDENFELQSLTGTWDADSLNAEGDNVSMSYDDGADTITLENSGETMTFARVADTVAEAEAA